MATRDNTRNVPATGDDLPGTAQECCDAINKALINCPGSDWPASDYPQALVDMCEFATRSSKDQEDDLHFLKAPLDILASGSFKTLKHWRETEARVLELSRHGAKLATEEKPDIFDPVAHPEVVPLKRRGRA